MQYVYIITGGENIEIYNSFIVIPGDDPAIAFDLFERSVKITYSRYENPQFEFEKSLREFKAAIKDINGQWSDTIIAKRVPVMLGADHL